MNKHVILDFVDAINCANVNKIYDLMTIDHLFIETQDNRTVGRDVMRQAWIGYLSLFPDYKIEINEIFDKDSLVCILGYASGTYKNLTNENNSNHWRIPAAWTAIVEDDHIKKWRTLKQNINDFKINS